MDDLRGDAQLTLTFQVATMDQGEEANQRFLKDFDLAPRVVYHQRFFLRTPEQASEILNKIGYGECLRDQDWAMINAFIQGQAAAGKGAEMYCQCCPGDKVEIFKGFIVQYGGVSSTISIYSQMELKFPMYSAIILTGCR